MTITYHASRDTASPQATDEDRAMAHVSIYNGADLTEARDALHAYMETEIRYLTSRGATGGYLSATGLRRAADLIDALAKIPSLATVTQPGPHRPGWSKDSFEAAGLLWSIVRIETEA